MCFNYKKCYSTYLNRISTNKIEENAFDKKNSVYSLHIQTNKF